MSDAKSVISEVLGDLVGYRGPIHAELTHADVPGWDSLAHINIVEELERRFQIRLSTDEMIEMNNLRAIASALSRHGVEARSLDS